MLKKSDLFLLPLHYRNLDDDEFITKTNTQIDLCSNLTDLQKKISDKVKKLNKALEKTILDCFKDLTNTCCRKEDPEFLIPQKDNSSSKVATYYSLNKTGLGIWDKWATGRKSQQHNLSDGQILNIVLYPKAITAFMERFFPNSEEKKAIPKALHTAYQRHFLENQPLLELYQEVGFSSALLFGLDKDKNIKQWDNRGYSSIYDIEIVSFLPESSDEKSSDEKSEEDRDVARSRRKGQLTTLLASISLQEMKDCLYEKGLITQQEKDEIQKSKSLQVICPISTAFSSYNFRNFFDMLLITYVTDKDIKSENNYPKVEFLDRQFNPIHFSKFTGHMRQEALHTYLVLKEILKRHNVEYSKIINKHEEFCHVYEKTLENFANEIQPFCVLARL